MCTDTTPACGNTCARGAGTHGDVLNLHMEVFSACQAAPHTPKHTHQNTPHTHRTHHTHTHRTHHTHHTHQHATTHNDRESGQRKREKRRERRETREGNTKDKMKDKTRKKRRQDERQDKRRSRDPEKIKMKCVVCVVAWLFLFFFSKLTDPRIISNFQNYRLPTLNTIFLPVNFCLCDCKLKLFQELIW